MKKFNEENKFKIYYLEDNEKEKDEWLKTDFGKFWDYCKKGNLGEMKKIKSKYEEIYSDEKFYQKCSNNFIKEIIHPKISFFTYSKNSREKESNFTPLHAFLLFHNLKDLKTIQDIIDYLLSIGARIKEKNNNGDTPLLTASLNRKFEVIEYLLKKGSEVNERNIWGNTPLLHACKYNNFKVIKYLLEKVSNGIGETNIHFNNPLLQACKHNTLEVIKYLLKLSKESKLYDKNIWGNTAFFHACKYNNLEVIEYLLNNGSSIEERNKYQESGLLMACFHNKLEVIQYLLNNGSKISETNIWGNTPFLHACKYNSLDVIKYLWKLSNESKIKEINQHFNTPLMQACKHNNNLEVVKFLLSNNISDSRDLSKRNKWGDSPILLACQNSDLKVVKYLLELRLKQKKDRSLCDLINEKYKDVTPLLLASLKNKRLEVIKYLYENSKLKEKKYRHCHSPLLLACENNNLKIIKYLLEKEGPLSLNNRNESPLDIAHRNNRKEAVKLIEKYIHSEINEIERESSSVVTEMNKKIENVVNEYKPIREKLKNKKLELINTLKHKKRKEEDYERLERISKEIEKQDNHQKNVSAFYHKENFIDFHHKLNKKNQIFEDKGFFKKNKSDLEAGVLKEFKRSSIREIIRIDIKQDNVLFNFLKRTKENLINEIIQEKKKEKKENGEDTQNININLSQEIKKKESTDQQNIVNFLVKEVSKYFYNPKINPDDIDEESNKILKEKQNEKGRNWIFLGELKNVCGVCRHKCLLFKLVCDEFGIKCRVYRGLSDGYFHNFNVVQLTDGKLLIVDVHNYEKDSKNPEYAISDLNLKTFNKITNLQNAHKGEDPKFDKIITFQLKKKCDTKIIKNDFIKPYNNKVPNEVMRKLISRGGFGSIFLFPLKVDGNDIVVKEINIQKISNSTGFQNKIIQKYVEKEIFFMNFLCHPNIIKIFNHFKIKNELNQDIYGLIMKKYSFDGEKFLELLKTYELEKQAIEFLVMLLKVSKGLKYLHDIEIIHLDIKPQNILIDFNDVEREIEDLVLTDFGNSKEKTRLFLKTITFGTPKYCAPELKEEDKEFNEKVDIYSFGKIMEDFKFCFKYWNENLKNLMKKCLDNDKKSRPNIDQIISVLKKELKYVRARVKKKKFSKELSKKYKEKFGNVYEIDRKKFFEKYNTNNKNVHMVDMIFQQDKINFSFKEEEGEDFGVEHISEDEDFLKY